MGCYRSSERAAISAPTVSMLVMVVPIPLSACPTGIKTTLMSKYFSISVSPRAGPAAMTGEARNTWVYLLVSDGSE